MRAHRRTFRVTGFSLIELLVVVAILGLLAVAVLPNLSNTSKTELVRQGTGKLSSFVALAQSRALGASTPRGLAFRQLSNSGSVFGGGVVLDLAACEGLEPYSGETSDSRVLVFVPTIAGTSPPRYYTRDYNGNGEVDLVDETALGDRNRNGVLEDPESNYTSISFWGTPYINLQFGPTASDFSAAAVRDGDLVMFEGHEHRFRLRNGTPFQLRDGALSALTSFVAEIRPELGESLSSVSWPAEARSVDFDPIPQNWTQPPAAFTSGSYQPLRYQVLRQPTLNSAVSDQLTGEACIDMAWTAVGYSLLRNQNTSLITTPCVYSFQDTTGPTYNDEFDPSLDLCILFDAVGRPNEILQIPTEGVTPTAQSFYRSRLTEPVFLLVGRSDRVGLNYVAGLNPDTDPDSGCNWQHPDSRWVGIDTNGRVVVAEPAPVSSPHWWEALYESQQFIRNDLGAAP